MFSISSSIQNISKDKVEAILSRDKIVVPKVWYSTEESENLATSIDTTYSSYGQNTDYRRDLCSIRDEDFVNFISKINTDLPNLRKRIKNEENVLGALNMILFAKTLFENFGINKNPFLRLNCLEIVEIFNNPNPSFINK